jgi:hypothetical protein
MKWADRIFPNLSQRKARLATAIASLMDQTRVRLLDALVNVERAKHQPSTTLVALMSLLFSISAEAATDGATIWGQLTGMWFGAPGLIIGAVVLTVGVIGFFRNGFGWTSVVFGICAAFFLVPGITMGLQKYAAGIATP